MKKIDDTLHAACSTVTFAIAFRKGLLKKTPEELAARFAAMPDPAYRERQRLSIEHGVAAAHVPPALAAYDRYIGEMEAALAKTPYLAGDAYSLADVAATPSCSTAPPCSPMDRLWVGRRPRVEEWFAAVRQGAAELRGCSEQVADGRRSRAVRYFAR